MGSNLPETLKVKIDISGNELREIGIEYFHHDTNIVIRIPSLSTFNIDPRELEEGTIHAKINVYLNQSQVPHAQDLYYVIRRSTSSRNPSYFDFGDTSRDQNQGFPPNEPPHNGGNGTFSGTTFGIWTPSNSPPPTNSFFQNALHLAVIYNRVSELQQLLNSNLRYYINIPDINGRTPLHYASSEEVFRILERGGAEIWNLQENSYQSTRSEEEKEEPFILTASTISITSEDVCVCGNKLYFTNHPKAIPNGFLQNQTLSFAPELLMQLNFFSFKLNDYIDQNTL